MFKVGDKVRRVSGTNATTPIGFEGVIRSIHRDPGDDPEYHFDGGTWGYARTQGQERWELVEPVLTFKVGDKVLRTSGSSSGQFMGYEGVVEKILDGWLHFPDGTRGLISKFELVTAATIGPVVTETVTKTRIVPGTYGRLRVFESGWGTEAIGVELLSRIGTSAGNLVFNADELDAAAAVLSALAKGLRDA